MNEDAPTQIHNHSSATVEAFARQDVEAIRQRDVKAAERRRDEQGWRDAHAAATRQTVDAFRSR